ncbi:MAG: hypothetical protein E7021_03225 [Alphaproteobacteria bacterium]|nr:hypothetical protein [Alphaproteobacteria bacterium]
MKRQLGVLCLVCLTLLGCASDKKVAPKEGRIALQEEVVIPKADGRVKLSGAKKANIVHSALYNAQNNTPMIAKITSTVSWKEKGANNQSDGGILLPAPITGKSNVYTLDSSFTARAHKRTDGEMLWQTDLSKTQDIGIGFVKDDNRLIALSKNGKVVAVDFKGNILWQKDLKAPFRNNPVLDKNNIYLLSANNDVWVLNADNGKENWHYKTQAPMTFLQQMGNPAIDGDRLIVPFSSGLVTAFDKNTGTFLWEQDMTGAKAFDHISSISQMTASPVIDDDKVYLVGHANRSGAFDLIDGEEIWSINHGGQLTPIVNANAIFILTNDDILLALDKTTGNLFWKQSLPKIKGKKGMYLLDSQIWVVGNEQSLVLNAKDGKIINNQESEVNGSRPILAQDGWYYLKKNGQLVHQGQLQ